MSSKSDMLSVDLQRPCPICRDMHHRHIVAERYGLQYWRCCACDLEFIDPVPEDDEELNKIEFDAKATREVSSGLLNYLVKVKKPRYLARMAEIERMVKSHFPHQQDLKLLDVGAGRGIFLHAVRGRFPAWTLLGIEPSPVSVEVARRHFGVNCVTGTVADLAPSNHYHAVTYFGVLEHITDARQELETVHSIMARGGILFLELPNLRSPLRAVFGQDVSGEYGFNPFHRLYFSPTSAYKLLECTGFRLEKIVHTDNIHSNYSAYNWSSLTGMARLRIRRLLVRLGFKEPVLSDYRQVLKARAKASTSRTSLPRPDWLRNILPAVVLSPVIGASRLLGHSTQMLVFASRQ